MSPDSPAPKTKRVSGRWWRLPGPGAALRPTDQVDIQAVTGGSDDGFLYARGFIVAMGQDFYDAVAGDPQVAVLEAECEEMCYFFAHRYRERFGQFPETGSGISRESCSTTSGA